MAGADNVSAFPEFYVGPSRLYLGAILGPCWVLLGRLGPMLAQLGTTLGIPGFYVGPSLAYLGACCAMQQLDSTVIYSVLCTVPTPKSPGPPPHPPHGSLCWAFLGSMLGHLGSILGPSWDHVGFCWVVLDLCWPSLGLRWAFLGSMLGHLWPILGHVARCSNLTPL